MGCGASGASKSHDIAYAADHPKSKNAYKLQPGEQLFQEGDILYEQDFSGEVVECWFGVPGYEWNTDNINGMIIADLLERLTASGAKGLPVHGLSFGGDPAVGNTKKVLLVKLEKKDIVALKRDETIPDILNDGLVEACRCINALPAKGNLVVAWRDKFLEGEKVPSSFTEKKLRAGEPAVVEDVDPGTGYIRVKSLRYSEEMSPYLPRDDFYYVQGELCQSKTPCVGDFVVCDKRQAVVDPFWILPAGDLASIVSARDANADGIADLQLRNPWGDVSTTLFNGKAFYHASPAYVAVVSYVTDADRLVLPGESSGKVAVRGSLVGDAKAFGEGLDGWELACGEVGVVADISASGSLKILNLADKVSPKYLKATNFVTITDGKCSDRFPNIGDKIISAKELQVIDWRLAVFEVATVRSLDKRGFLHLINSHGDASPDGSFIDPVTCFYISAGYAAVLKTIAERHAP